MSWPYLWSDQNKYPGNVIIHGLLRQITFFLSWHYSRDLCKIVQQWPSMFSTNGKSKLKIFIALMWYFARRNSHVVCSNVMNSPLIRDNSLKPINAYRLYASVDWTSIVSDSSLSPIRHQAIIWTIAGILLIGPLGIKIQWNLNRNWYIFIQENWFENVVWKNGGHFFLGFSVSLRLWNIEVNVEVKSTRLD